MTGVTWMDSDCVLMKTVGLYACFAVQCKTIGHYVDLALCLWGSASHMFVGPAEAEWWWYCTAVVRFLWHPGGFLLLHFCFYFQQLQKEKHNRKRKHWQLSRRQSINRHVSHNCAITFSLQPTGTCKGHEQLVPETPPHTPHTPPLLHLIGVIPSCWQNYAASQSNNCNRRS